MERKTKRQVKQYLSWGALAVLVTVLAVMPLLTGGEPEETGPKASILSTQPESAVLEQVLLGGGTLESREPEEVKLHQDVKLTRFLVKNGDYVRLGDPIAEVDRVSVMSAIASVQDALDSLTESLEDVRDVENTQRVTAGAGGTVKILYAQPGDSVPDVMLRYGALAVLSLDDRMAVTVAAESTLAAGDTVTVKLPETEVTGRVESNLEGILTVSIPDGDYPVGMEAALISDGTVLGTGTLEIHCPWNAVAYSGTVEKVHVKEGGTVSAGKNLLTLKDTGNAADYYGFWDQRQAYEEAMLELFRLYQSEAITAPVDGIVSGIDEESPQLLNSDGNWYLSLLTGGPLEEDPEVRYANFLGQVRMVGIDGLILHMAPQDIEITDYRDLSALEIVPEQMTEEVLYQDDAPIYEYVAETWVQIPMEEIRPEDLLLFSRDPEGDFVWVIRISDKEPEIPEETLPDPLPTEPIPTEPAETEPAVPNIPLIPNIPQINTGDILQGMGGSLGGYAGGYVQEEEALYGLTEVVVAAVTPQDMMTLEFAVDELDVALISAGQEVQVTVDAVGQEIYPGIITKLSNQGAGNGGSSKFAVQVTLPRAEGMLSGMNAAVKLNLGKMEAALTLPLAALVETGRETMVCTALDEDGNPANPVTVTTGISDGERVQILSGLEPDSTVYYAYYDTLELDTSADSGGFGMFG